MSLKNSKNHRERNQQEIKKPTRWGRPIGFEEERVYNRFETIARVMPITSGSALCLLLQIVILNIGISPSWINPAIKPTHKPYRAIIAPPAAVSRRLSLATA
jgi:hypothetical protein